MTINNRKIFYIISAALITLSIFSAAFFGLPAGIDFKGGSFMEVTFLPGEDGEVNVLSKDEVREVFTELDVGDVVVQEAVDDKLIFRFREVDEETRLNILAGLEGVTDSELREDRFESVGPVIGQETIKMSIQAVVFVLIMIVAYVAWAFRKISYPIGSTRYGFIALAALFHDMIITVGVFAFFAHLTGGEIGVPFVAALLTILGYSVNDTIVIFDRVRENIFKFGDRLEFDVLVSKSVKESVVRSVNTSLTTLFVLFAIFFFGGATLQNFIFTLIIGIIMGTYSSLAFASPMLVSWAKRIHKDLDLDLSSKT